jgi:hypothetical protein
VEIFKSYNIEPLPLTEKIMSEIAYLEQIVNRQQVTKEPNKTSAVTGFQTPSARTQPAQINNAPYGIAISGGVVTNPTVNNGPPTPRLSWSVVNRPQPENAKHPRAYVKISLDKSLVDAKFAVTCDRACNAVETGPLPGFNGSTFLRLMNFPQVAAFVIIGPNPFPADIEDFLGVESADDEPVRILDVAKFELTEEQKLELRRRQKQ